MVQLYGSGEEVSSWTRCVRWRTVACETGRVQDLSIYDCLLSALIVSGFVLGRIYGLGARNSIPEFRCEFDLDKHQPLVFRYRSGCTISNIDVKDNRTLTRRSEAASAPLFMTFPAPSPACSEPLLPALPALTASGISRQPVFSVDRVGGGATTVRLSVCARHGSERVLDILCHQLCLHLHRGFVVLLCFQHSADVARQTFRTV